MGLFSKRQKEIFEESLEGGPTVIADKIQANV
jgi:hypothetical protein